MMSRQIYFAGSIRGGRQDVEIYYKIIEELKTYGKILTEFVGDKNITDEEGTSRSPGKETDKGIHDLDVKMLSECDFLVAEVTQTSLGVGYEIGRAVAMNKNVLCLYRSQESKSLSAMIRGAENGSSFIVTDYKDVSETEQILKNYFTSRN